MNIEIHSPDLQARIRKQLEVTGSANIEQVLERLLETQEEQDRWLQENQAAINSKIRQAVAQLDRGESIPEEELDEYLAKLKTERE